MAQFKALASGVEVNGETVLSVVDGMGTFQAKALQILADNGIINPAPGQWFPQQAWLDAFSAISEKIGSATLFMIGKKIPENAQFPPAIDDLEKALSAIDIAYHMNHRGGEIGSYRYQMTGERSGRMVCRNPYPCEFDRGIISAMATRFKPADVVQVRVNHDDKSPCRRNGAEECSYTIEW